MCGGHICIADVQRNKSLVHAYALPTPLKRTLEMENCIKYPCKNPVIYPVKTKVDAAIELFALNVKNTWNQPETVVGTERGIGIGTELELESENNLVSTALPSEEQVIHEMGPKKLETPDIPQWGYFSFSEASSAINRLTGITNNNEIKEKKRENLDYENDHEMLEIGMKIYDALYSWARYVQEEKHTWNPIL